LFEIRLFVGSPFPPIQKGLGMQPKPLGYRVGSSLGQMTWTFRPSRRLRLIALRPPTERILARNPIFFARFRFDILCG
jgi:hypothetical protein